MSKLSGVSRWRRSCWEGGAGGGGAEGGAGRAVRVQDRLAAAALAGTWAFAAQRRGRGRVGNEAVGFTPALRWIPRPPTMTTPA